MGRRQLSRLVLALVAVAVIGLVVTALEMRSEDGHDPVGPDDPVPAAATRSGAEPTYVAEARRLATTLAEFSQAASSLRDHEALVDGSSPLDDIAAELAALEDPSGLADVVCGRWAAIRPVALSEETADAGVQEVQALGREVGRRAAELVTVLDDLSGPDRRAALEEVLAEPWPSEADEGADTPV